MKVVFSHFLIAALFVAPAAFADDGKMCTASARECEQAIRQLSSGRRYLGAEIEQRSHGISIKTVKDNSPAARAGLIPGDRLISINRRDTREASIKDVKQILYDAKTTGVVWIIVQRDGLLKMLDVRLAPYSKEQIDKMVAQHLAQSHAIATTTPPTAPPQQ